VGEAALVGIGCTPKTGENGGYQIVVLSKGSDGYSVRLLDHAETGSLDSGLVISKERSGTYSDFETSKPVHLTLDGLNVEWLEKEFGTVLLVEP
jgi:hypothetical protein